MTSSRTIVCGAAALFLAVFQIFLVFRSLSNARRKYEDVPWLRDEIRASIQSERPKQQTQCPEHFVPPSVGVNDSTLPPACTEDASHVASAAFCESSQSPYLFIVVLSAPSNFDRRHAQRGLLFRSRARMTPDFVQNNRWSYAFLVGKPTKGAPAYLQRQIDAESCRYKDILQVDVFDDYYNLTRKRIAAFEFFLRSDVKFEILLKTDDDCYVNVQATLEWLRSVTPFAYEKASRRLEKLGRKSAAAGKYFYGGAGRLDAIPVRYEKSAYYISMDDYPRPVFPPLINGPGYFLSYDLIKAMMALDGDRMPSFRLEDVHTAIMVNRTGLMPGEMVTFTKRVVILNSAIRPQTHLCIDGDYSIIVMGIMGKSYTVFPYLFKAFIERYTC